MWLFSLYDHLGFDGAIQFHHSSKSNLSFLVCITRSRVWILRKSYYWNYIWLDVCFLFIVFAATCMMLEDTPNNQASFIYIDMTNRLLSDDSSKRCSKTLLFHILNAKESLKTDVWQLFSLHCSNSATTTQFHIVEPVVHNLWGLGTTPMLIFTIREVQCSHKACA